uniref:Lhr family helicase n=1 Tax=Paraburkholderia caledonica TaxID=134536 RepID=UPI003F973E68
ALHGAMFFDELLTEVGGLRMELESALGELVAAGLVNSDSFAGLRALLKPVAKRSAYSSSRRVRSSALIGGMDDAGRWALIKRPAKAGPENGNGDDDGSENGSRAALAANGRRAPLAPEILEHIAMTLLRRYGVVFWRLLEREAEWLPPWRDLLRVFQRLEARGQVRGGRFVNGLAGDNLRCPRRSPAARSAPACERRCLGVRSGNRSAQSRRHLADR